MPATVTLSTTTLSAPVNGFDGVIKVASTAGILPGLRLFVDGEAMTVISLGIDPYVNVRRGSDGTTAKPHASSQTVYIARGDQLYRQDPKGRPLDEIEVSPWINVRTGSVWFAQGDTAPAGGFADRWWQLQTTTYDTGALGVTTKTLSPTAST